MNKFWLSLALYNAPLQNKPFSFVFMPAYGFGSNKIIGLGQVSLQLFPKKVLYEEWHSPLPIKHSTMRIPLISALKETKFSGS
jgi:hypothetical protein